MSRTVVARWISLLLPQDGAAAMRRTVALRRTSLPLALVPLRLEWLP
jgi:hypothetical protein